VTDANAGTMRILGSPLRLSGEPRGRVQGSEYERRGAEYVAERFEAWGLENLPIESLPLTSGAGSAGVHERTTLIWAGSG
jgi:hypothetical protein